MIETLALLFSVAQVKTASEMEKARQHIFGHRSPVGEPARRCHQNIGAPKIGIEKIARAGGKLMHPFQTRRARVQILQRRPTRERDLRGGESIVAILEGARRRLPVADGSIHSTLRPRGTKL